ncbi:unnamed protein product [Haemonchus placei]|uniref:Uncharacterized protein n=1 Tax=Haemonchus placei TaxID=6290 RepID=A0A3P7TLX2_HAEPC|nr:unnamed protein product [Haemonchus placei]
MQLVIQTSKCLDEKVASFIRELVTPGCEEVQCFVQVEI